MRIFSLTATEKRLLNKLSWRAVQNHTHRRVFLSRPLKKTGNLPGTSVRVRFCILLAATGKALPRDRRNSKPLPAPKGWTRHCRPLHTGFLFARFEIGHTQRKNRPELAATSRVIAYRAVSNHDFRKNPPVKTRKSPICRSHA